MKKLKASHLLAAAEELRAESAETARLSDIFADDQPEILEFIEDPAEEEDGLTDKEKAFLQTVAFNVWHALRTNGCPPPAAERKTLLALEEANRLKLRNAAGNETRSSDTLLKALDGHPQDELARSAFLLSLSADEKEDGMAPANIVLPVMAIVDSLCGLKPPREMLDEMRDLPPRRWLGIADLRLTEPAMDHMHRSMAGKNFASIDEMNAFLQEHRIGHPEKIPPATPLQAAQDLIYQAMDHHSLRVRRRLALKALSLSPDCADAYNLLAEDEAETPEGALEYYEKAAEAGRRALGEAFLEKHRDKLWGDLAARPYMRALAGRARTLHELDRREEAEKAYYELLDLNTSDNQGIRYVLLTFHAEKDEYEKIEALINGGRYPDDCAAEWLYTGALAAFTLGRPGASQLLQQALRANRHVPDYLLNANKPAEELGDSVALGGEDEAFSYSLNFKEAWSRSPGALVWLRSGVKALSGAPGRNDPCPCGSGKKYKKCCGR
ncbi:MAG: ST7 protein [Elusimicrobia bacterium]|nr:MAG: ST7 protein [Elusimicrobiota bacterium]KAF0153745.1 MAG: ST7 protein [Elusimicrobiota bacterium]